MSPRYADPRDRYRLDRRIATGGMGQVWQATDTLLERGVAVKLLKPELADDAVFRSRFLAEARLAGAVHHDGIASLFDFGENAQDPDGVPFLVMELVDGRPLSDLLRQGPMDPDRVRDLLGQAAVALGVAHTAGIVHRDVKPGNILVTAEDQVKLTDFGIARAAQSADLTMTGQIIGTPAYLAPEQADGASASAASDVYGLGVVAYEALAGRRPFVGDTPVAVAIAHLRQPVPPLPAGIPDDLARTVQACLDKDPARRPADGTAVARLLGHPVGGFSLDRAADHTRPVSVATDPDLGPPTEPHPAPRPRVVTTPPPTRHFTPPTRWWPAAVAALALVAVGAALVLPGDDGATSSAEAGVQTSSSAGLVRVDAKALVGLPVAEARRLLRGLGLDSELRRRPMARDTTGEAVAGTVARVSPFGRVAEGTTVKLVVWRRATLEPTPAPEPSSAPADSGPQGDKPPQAGPPENKGPGANRGQGPGGPANDNPRGDGRP
ncbi:MAG: serine/threonine protein kinase [Nocardioides sp.]|nr:serine/threonine protein kinase [Nocardioides sp.]